MTNLTKLAMATLLFATPALADTPAAPAKGAPAAPKDKAAPDAKKAEPKKDMAMAMPKPPKEVEELAKAMVGTWKCTGQTSMDGKTMVDTKATSTIKLNTDLDKWWIQTDFAATMGKETYKFTGFTTFSQVDNKWVRYIIDNMGSFEMDTSAGLNTKTGAKESTLSWEGESKMTVAMAPGAPTTIKSRHTEVISAAGVHMTGEFTMDGKTWIKGYDATCKK
jgi:hypothetical protein